MEIGFSAMENARAASEDCRASTPPKLALEIATLRVFKVRLYPRFWCDFKCVFRRLWESFEMVFSWLFLRLSWRHRIVCVKSSYGGIATEICNLRDTWNQVSQYWEHSRKKEIIKIVLWIHLLTFIKRKPPLLGMDTYYRQYTTTCRTPPLVCKENILPYLPEYLLYACLLCLIMGLFYSCYGYIQK